VANDAHAAEAVHQVGRDLHGELVGAGGSWHVGVVDADEDHGEPGSVVAPFD
jgi:hypothetical protein